MSKYDDYSIDLVVFMLRKMADKMEEDPAFAQQILEESKANRQAALKKSKKAEKKPAKKILQPAVKAQDTPSDSTKKSPSAIVENASSLADIYALFIEGNEEGLRNCLEQYEMDTLRAIVSKNHLDLSGKVRKWKAKQRVIDFIVATVNNRVSQGDAFKIPDNK